MYKHSCKSQYYCYKSLHYCMDYSGIHQHLKKWLKRFLREKFYCKSDNDWFKLRNCQRQFWNEYRLEKAHKTRNKSRGMPPSFIIVSFPSFATILNYSAEQCKNTFWASSLFRIQTMNFQQCCRGVPVNFLEYHMKKLSKKSLMIVNFCI